MMSPGRISKTITHSMERAESRRLEHQGHYEEFDGGDSHE